MIMFLLVAAFVIIGDFVDAIPAIIIFMPIINKLTEIGGINPVHMGVVIIVTLAFGLITPPYGIALLMAAKFVDVKFSAGAAALAAALCRLLRRDRLLHPLPGHRAVAPQASCCPESVGCFKSPARHRLYLPG